MNRYKVRYFIIYISQIRKMSAIKPVQCFHKITQFQAHRGCNLFSSICEKECQQIHKTYDKEQILVISLQMIQQQFKRITEILNLERNKYSNNLKNLYESIFQQIEKHMKNSLKEMQSQIQAEMMKKLTIQKTLIEKLQNKRYERIKCHQLITLIEETQPQQKIKKSALAQIYQKYKNQTNKFRESLFQGRPIPAVQENPLKQTQTIPVSTQQKSTQAQKVNFSNTNLFKGSTSQANSAKYFLLYQQKSKQLKKVQQFNQKLRYDMKVLATEKFNLQRQLSNLNSAKPNNKKRKLILKTWNIAQVITKKIKKVRNQNQQAEAQGINKINDPLVIQEDLTKSKPNLQTERIQNKPPAEESKLNTIQIQQNELKLPINEAIPKQPLNQQMEDQSQQGFIEYLKKRKLL